MRPVTIIIMLIASAIAMQAEAQFNGLVVDGTGRPVRKAKIWVKDPAQYASTDKEGKFGLSEVAPDDTLNVKIKKETYRIPVNGRKAVKITVIGTEVKEVKEEPALADLGYGYVKRRERINASSGITGARLVATGATDILSALSGLVPGLNVRGSARGGDRSATIRGIHSFQSSSEPLYVVDGIVTASLDNISLYDVEMVEVLKDAPIYGSRGANGAILVTTKRGKK